jgi:cytochrome P450 family 9
MYGLHNMEWFASEVAVILTTGLIVCLYIAYRYITRNNDYFSRRNVPHIKPTFLFGNIGPVFMRKISMLDHVNKLYSELDGHKVAGMFQFLQPMYMVRDPELIKHITVKDFDHFVDLPILIPEDSEPSLTKTLQGLNGNILQQRFLNCSPFIQVLHDITSTFSCSTLILVLR